MTIPRQQHYFAYVRVSTARQGEQGSSLDAQRTAIEAYADRNGLEISRWYEEILTAAKRGRPAFKSMVSKVKAGRAKGILVHKIDRSARNLHDWATFSDLADIGAEIHFCHEQLDLTSRSGRLSADIQAVVAADYVRNLREESRKGMYARLDQGIWPWHAPLGYLNEGGGRPKSIDPDKGAKVRELFRLYASGRHSLHSLKDETARMGLTNQRGGPMTINNLCGVLNNRFYYGLLHIRKTGETFPGLHEPLIEQITFERAEAVRKGRLSARPIRHDFAYRRLLTCSRCGRSLTGELKRGHVYYRCHSKTCKGTCLREESTDEALVALTLAIQLPVQVIRAVRDVLARRSSTEERAWQLAVGRRKQELATREEQLQRLMDTFLEGDLERELFTDRKRRLLDAIAGLKREGTRKQPHAAAIVQHLEVTQEQAMRLPGAPAQVKREILRHSTSNRMVSGKKLVFMPSAGLKPILDWDSVPSCTQDRDGVRMSSATRKPCTKKRRCSKCIEQLVVELMLVVPQAL